MTKQQFILDYDYSRAKSGSRYSGIRHQAEVSRQMVAGWLLWQRRNGFAVARGKSGYTSTCGERMLFLGRPRRR